MPGEIHQIIGDKIGQSGHSPQSGKATKTGRVTLSATEARQGVRVGMVRRVLALSLAGAVVAMMIAYILR
jgi:hypothetical protein